MLPVCQPGLRSSDAAADAQLETSLQILPLVRDERITFILFGPMRFSGSRSVALLSSSVVLSSTVLHCLHSSSVLSALLFSSQKPVVWRLCGVFLVCFPNMRSLLQDSVLPGDELVSCHNVHLLVVLRHRGHGHRRLHLQIH